MILPESQKSDGKKIKVLLVDDEIHFVEVLFKRLSKRNMDVTKTFSGTEGIQALRQVDFDVAVLDLKMEDIDGLEVLKIFKKMYPKIEVIILTGHESEQTAQEGLQYGAFAYLTKPCDFDQLFDTIIKAASD